MLNANHLRQMDTIIIGYLDRDHSKENKETAENLRWTIHKELRKFPIKVSRR